MKKVEMRVAVAHTTAVYLHTYPGVLYYTSLYISRTGGKKGHLPSRSPEGRVAIECDRLLRLDLRFKITCVGHFTAPSHFSCVKGTRTWSELTPRAFVNKASDVSAFKPEAIAARSYSDSEHSYEIILYRLMPALLYFYIRRVLILLVGETLFYWTSTSRR